MWFHQNKDKILISICVVPRSPRTEIIGIYADCLKIKLKSSPVHNAANEELISFLSKKLKIPKKSLEIVLGHSSKKKVVSIVDCNVNLISDLLLK